MKTLKDIIKEATLEQLPRRTKAFVDKHVVQKTDYPVDVEDQFTAKKLKKDKTKLASFHDGEDASVYEEVEQIDELSPNTLKSYAAKSYNQANALVKQSLSDQPKSVQKASTAAFKRRSAGIKAAGRRLGSDEMKKIHSDVVREEVDLDEGVSNLSDARLKFHVLNNIPHGSYDKKEMSAEHLRRKKTGGPAYNAVKPSMNEEVEQIDEAYTLYHPSYTDAINTALNHHKDLTVSSDDRDTHIASGPRKPSEGKTVSHNIPATDKSGNAHMIHIQVHNKGGSKPFELNTYSSKVPKKRMKEEASMSPTDMKQRENIVKGMKKNTQDFKDRYGSKWKSVMYATATKAAMKEEAEQIDEVSATTLSKYSMKAARQGDDRLAGQKMADEKIRKQQGKSSTAKVAAESVDLDEAFKAGAMKLNDGSSVTLTNESSNSLNNLFNQLSSSNKTKMEQRLMSGSKGFNEILAFAKEV